MGKKLQSERSKKLWCADWSIAQAPAWASSSGFKPQAHQKKTQSCQNTIILAGGQWFTPIILVTQEAKIKKIRVWGQSGQQKHDPI
jgi:hypothetical protein